MTTTERKYNLLLEALRRYQKLAIAFSGGVDSTLLLHAALVALGPENVMALCARSALSSLAVVQGSRTVYKKNFPHASALNEIAVSPLSWQEFVVNDKDRCYFCKKRMYTILQETMKNAGYSILADGTNYDDRQEVRPGLRVVSELHIATPLADVGLTKSDVRRLAENVGLTNFDLPSNSCLATRIPENIPIVEKTLREVELAEDFLHQHGFLGCRVRMMTMCTIIEVLEKDIVSFVNPINRQKIQAFFADLQLAPVVLNLVGR